MLNDMIIDGLDRLKAAYTLFSKLQKAEDRAEKEGWIDAEVLESEFWGIDTE